MSATAAALIATVDTVAVVPLRLNAPAAGVVDARVWSNVIEIVEPLPTMLPEITGATSVRLVTEIENAATSSRPWSASLRTPPEVGFAYARLRAAPSAIAEANVIVAVLPLTATLLAAAEPVIENADAAGVPDESAVSASLNETTISVPATFVSALVAVGASSVLFTSDALKSAIDLPSAACKPDDAVSGPA